MLPGEKRVMRFFLALSILVLIGTSVFGEDSPPGLGMWSWSQKNFVTPEARRDLLDLSSREGIVHIDQHIGMTQMDGGYEVKNTEALRHLLREASDRGISINALRGERTMFFEKNHERAMAQLEALVSFNASLPTEARFVGIKYDVEPYLTPQWREGGESRQKVITDYLSILRRARGYLESQN